MNKKGKAQGIVLIIMGIALMGLWINYTNKRDVMIEKASAEYEACVKDQLHTTPALYYEEHHSLPDCQ